MLSLFVAEKKVAGAKLKFSLSLALHRDSFVESSKNHCSCVFFCVFSFQTLESGFTNEKNKSKSKSKFTVQFLT